VWIAAALRRLNPFFWPITNTGAQETAVRIFAACKNQANKNEFKDEMEDDTDL